MLIKQDIKLMQQIWHKFRHSLSQGTHFLFQGTRSIKNPIVLAFNLPGYRQQRSRLPLLATLIEQISGLENDPVRLLSKVYKFIYAVNRISIESHTRMRLTTPCLEYACKAIHTVYSEFHKGDALPESPTRNESLNTAIAVTMELAIAYKHIFQQDITSPTRQYKIHRIRTSAQNVMEMLFTEQRLRALRYQYLSKSTWLDCNRMFFAMLEHGGVDHRFKMKGCVFVSWRIKDKWYSQQPEFSLHELYVCIHLFGLMDTNTLTPLQINVTDIYLRQYVSHLKMVRKEYTEPARKYYHFHRELTKPAVIQQYDREDSDSRYLDMHPIKQLLEKENERLNAQVSPVETDPNKTLTGKTKFTCQEDLDRILVVRTMLRRFQLQRRKENREYLQGEDRVFIFNGFKTSFDSLMENNKKQHKAHANNHPLRNSLALASSKLKRTSGTDKLPQWILMNKSNRGALIETKETPLTARMFVGQIILYKHEKTDIKNPIIGYVCRLHRPRHRVIQIAIQNLSNQVESIIVQNEFLQKNVMGLPGLLVFDFGETLRLILHYSHRLAPGANVVIRRNGMDYDCKVNNIQIMQKEFIVYGINTH